MGSHAVCMFWEPLPGICPAPGNHFVSEESGLVRTRRDRYLLPKVGHTDSRSLWKSGNRAVLPLARFLVQDWIGGVDEVCGPWLTMAGTAPSCWLMYHMLKTTGGMTETRHTSSTSL